MRLIKAIAGASFLLVSVAAGAAVDHEADLQQMLGKRVEAGPPVDCLQIGTITGSHIVDRTAIIYEVAGGDMYVNRPDIGASSLDRHKVLVTDTHIPQLCSVDTVTLIDSTTGIQSGFVGLGKFVPYKKVR
jgi:hypothetical protein